MTPSTNRQRDCALAEVEHHLQLRQHDAVRSPARGPIAEEGAATNVNDATPYATTGRRVCTQVTRTAHFNWFRSRGGSRRVVCLRVGVESSGRASCLSWRNRGYLTSENDKGTCLDVVSNVDCGSDESCSCVRSECAAICVLRFVNFIAVCDWNWS